MSVKLLNTILLSVLIIMVAIVISFNVSQSRAIDSRLSLKDRIEMGNEYLNNELYEKAIEMYESVIFDESYDRNRRANMLFRIAEIYKDDLKDYEGALSSFLLLRKVFPENARSEDIERGIIECLDNLGRRAQAQRRLEQAVTLGRDVEDVPPDQIVAKLGNRAITISDLHKWINELPPDVARQYSTPEQRFEFLKLKVADQLLYDAALRAGYDRRQNIKNRLAEMERQILSTAYYHDNVREGITATEDELMNFYHQNKDRFFGGKDFIEVQDSVESLFSQHKLMEARVNLSRKLFEAERVQLFPQNLGLGENAN